MHSVRARCTQCAHSFFVERGSLDAALHVLPCASAHVLAHAIQSALERGMCAASLYERSSNCAHQGPAAKCGTKTCPKYACGNAREMLNACAQERERPSVRHFGEHQNCMATHMSCVRTSRLSVRLITCASTCMLASPMCSSRATSASRGTTTQNLYMDARVNVCGAHIGYISAQHVIAAARNIYHQAAC